MSWLVPFTQGLCIFEGGGGEHNAFFIQFLNHNSLFAGVLLNLYLFYLVVISKRSSTSDPVYKVNSIFFLPKTKFRYVEIAISFFSVHGFTLCAIIAVFNFVCIFFCWNWSMVVNWTKFIVIFLKGHLFREGTFVAVALNPLAQFLPMPLNSMIFRVSFSCAAIFLLVLSIGSSYISVFAGAPCNDVDAHSRY